MHVFLTGDRRVGKSRAVKRVTEMTSRPIKGFLTRFLTSERGSSSLYMLPAERPESFDPEHMVACLTDGKMRPVPGMFDTLGVDLLKEAAGDPDALILMDECGHLEKNAPLFQKAILDCLDGPAPVLGVLRRDQPWHEMIKNHPRVRLITVTPYNREGLADRILRLLDDDSAEKAKDAEEEILPWEVNGVPQAPILCSPGDEKALILGKMITEMMITDKSAVEAMEDPDGVLRVTAGQARLPAPDIRERLEKLPACPVGPVTDRDDPGMLPPGGDGRHTVLLETGAEKILCRDISRHNALDRAVGTAALKEISLAGAVMVFSGRLSLEILLKAAAAGIRRICTRKQAGTLAREYAEKLGVDIIRPDDTCQGGQT